MRRRTAWMQRDLLGLLAGLIVLVAVTAGYLALGQADVPLVGIILAPAVTAILARAWATAVIGLASALTAFGLAVLDDAVGWGGAVVRLVLALGAGVVAVLLAAQRDRREAKLTEGRTLNQLRALTSALAGAVTVRDVAETVVQHGRLALRSTTAVAYALVDQDTLELLAFTAPSPLQLEGLERIPLDAQLPVADVVRHRTTVVVDRRVLEADYPALARRGVAQSRLMVGVPLSIEGEVVGALFFGFSRAAGISPSERSLARAVADQAALALQRARLYEASLRAEASVRILQEVTAVLADAFTVEEISAVVLRESLQRVDAHAALVAFRDERDPEVMGVVAALGFPADAVDRWRRFPVDAPLPVSECLRSNDLVVVESRADMVARYPNLEHRTTTEDARSLLCVPIPARHGPVAVLAYVYADERHFDKAARELYSSIAAQCGQAFERAHLLAAEARRHERVRLGAERGEQLDQLTEAFSFALTVDEVVEAFVSAALPTVGARDGAVYLLDRGRHRLVALGVAGAGSTPDVLLEEDVPLTQAASRGQPVFLRVDERGQEHESEAYTRAVVPMRAFGVTVGVLNLQFEEARTVDPDDRDHLVTVGERCGDALERARLYEAERMSRLEAQRSAESLAELQSLTAALTRSASSSDVAAAVLDAALPALGAKAGFVLVPRDAELAVVGLRNLAPPAEAWRLEHSALVGQVLSTGNTMAVEQVEELAEDDGRAYLQDAGLASLVLVPLWGRDRVVGVLAVGWSEPGAPGAKGSSVLATMAAVCGQALVRAGVYDVEHAIADTLQRSMLPVLPVRLGRIELQGRYRPGATGTQVGGDWFDAIVLPDERVCLVVGDVEGRGVRAAATMGQLRAALRALTRTTSDPAALLEALNDGLLASASPMVTMAIAIVDRDGHVLYGYAGHPPIYARWPDGRVLELPGGRSVPLGVVDRATFRTAETMVPRGSTLALYTDGLIERRAASLDEGLQRLIANLEPHADALTELADRLVGLADEEGTDDVAVLVARLAAGDDRIVFQPLRDLSEVRSLRATVSAWLLDHGATDNDVLAVTLSVAEATVNALQHAYPITGGPVDVAVELDGDGVRATVRDQGRWRDPEVTTDGKRGLVLMRGLTDVALDSGADGTTVTIRRRLGAQA